MTETAFILLFLLFTKHMVCDYVLQNTYQLNGKGIYGHLGGIQHAGYHGIGTFAVLLFVISPFTALLWAIIDAVIHYHIDWAKVHITKRTTSGPADNLWWVLFGLDQYLHYVTYLAIVWFVL